MNDHRLIDESRREFSCFNVVQLATARAAELAAFEASVNVLTVRATSKLQRLPVRLRRRAASHRINRLPRRLHRYSTLNGNLVTTVQVGTQKRTKLKSRRYRRRNLRLLALAARLAPFTDLETADEKEKRKPAWLPTHLWHAKRFHMVNRWGWRLPHAPNNKVFKACQAASKNGCLVVDMSYLTCLSVEGTEDAVANLVQQVFRENMQTTEVHEVPWGTLATETCGLLFTSPQRNVTDESIHFMGPTILGPARLLWSPENWPRPGYRCVYFWVHPAIASETRELLTLAVQRLVSSPPMSDCANALHIRVLTGQLCRLRLLGRQSHRLLGEILSPCVGTKPNSDWSVWKHMQTEFHQASLVPEGTVMLLQNCGDFRLNRPALKVRNRNWVALDPTESPTTMPAARPSSDIVSSIRSLLYDSHCERSPVTWGVMPHSGTHQDPIINKDQIGVDILLIRNGCASLSRDYPNCIGWDVVMSRSRFPVDDGTLLQGTLAARDLLIACVYRGAEVGGQRDLHRWATIGTHGRGHTEAFPQSLWPDTKAGRDSDAEARDNRLLRHNRLPVNLRPEYTLFGTANPFRAPWNELISEHASFLNTSVGLSRSEPPVLRSAVLLHGLVQPLLQGNKNVLTKLKGSATKCALLCQYLLLVHVQSIHRGVPEPCAIIYAPCDERDLKQHNTPQEKQRDSANNTVETIDNRIILGYVQEGGYDHSTGRGSGLGFISLAALIRSNMLLKSNTLRHGFSQVLLKNPKSTCIRIVHVSLVPSSTP